MCDIVDPTQNFAGTPCAGPPSSPQDPPTPDPPPSGFTAQKFRSFFGRDLLGPNLN